MGEQPAVRVPSVTGPEVVAAGMRPSCPSVSRRRRTRRTKGAAISLFGALGSLLATAWLLFPAEAARAADGPGSNPHDLIRVGETVFFRADDGVHGDELWATRGTGASTHLVKDINPGSGGSLPETAEPDRARARLGGELYFLASSPGHCNSLWKSNGTRTGTVRVADWSGCAHIQDFAVVGSTLYFLSDGGGLHLELWRSDGTTPGTGMVDDI